MAYFSWNKTVITDFSDKKISSMYEQGYVFTREEIGSMNQTRSLRIDLSNFELSSENRRVLKKMDGIQIEGSPLPFENYSWKVGKLAKDFYDTKFGDKTFSANKAKELLTDEENSNFNVLLHYGKGETTLGFAICFAGADFLHYSYPFYDLKSSPKSMGLGMMSMAIMLAKEQGDRYIYLGSATRPNDTYKLQFSGLEWFTLSEVDGLDKAGKWSNNITQLKEELEHA